MKIEDMTLKQVKEYCINTGCKNCKIGANCEVGEGWPWPFNWNLDGDDDMEVSE